MKLANSKLYAIIQCRISNAYFEYVFATDDEMAAIGNPQCVPQDVWVSISYPAIITIDLPIVNRQFLTDEMQKIRKFFTISKPRWLWFSMSPLYQQLIDVFVSFPQARYQAVLLHVLINYITDANNKYTSLSNALKKYMFTNDISKELHNYVVHGQCAPTIALNPDKSMSLLTRLCG